LTTLTQRSACGFKLGLRGGSRRDASILERLVERRTVLGIAIVSQKPTIHQEANVRHREVARDLGHPGLIREGVRPARDPARRHMHDDKT